jgi:hypothetical protein
MSAYSNLSSIEEFLKLYFISRGTPACEDVYSQEKAANRDKDSVLFWILKFFTARGSSGKEKSF